MIHLPKQGMGFDSWLGTNILHASRETKPTAVTTETLGTRACFLQQEKATHCKKTQHSQNKIRKIKLFATRNNAAGGLPWWELVVRTPHFHCRGHRFNL